MKFNFKSKLGFTLIELLVVIGILAVLAAIAIPSVAGLIDRANVSSDATNANEMTNAIERFVSEYELYCQDIASNKVNLNDLDSAQGRVYNVTGIDDRADIELIESTGLNGKQINRDTKYPANALTLQSVTENYMKTSSSPFEPKQSDCHYYYSPDCGLVVCTETKKSSVDDLNKLVQNGKDAKGKDLSLSTKWIDLTNSNTNVEVTKAIRNESTLVQYDDLTTALNEASANETIKMYQDVTVSQPIVAVNGITIDINGFVLTAPSVVTTDANIIDSQDGVGVVKLGSTSLSVKSNNIYFPIYDNTNGGYRLFQYELINRGIKTNSFATDGKIKAGISLKFNNLNAYTIISQQYSSAGTSVGVMVRVPDLNSYEHTYTFSQNIITTYVNLHKTEYVSAQAMTFSLTVDSNSPVKTGMTIKLSPFLQNTNTGFRIENPSLDFVIP